MFSEKTQALLEKAGWHPAYTADVSEYQHLMEKEGCPLPPVVVSFLQKYGGLYVKYPHPLDPSYHDYFHLDGLKAAAAYPGQYCTDLEHFSERIGSKVYAIGEGRHELLLMMSEEGKVYCGIDQTLTFLGETGEEAIEALIHGTDRKRVP